MDYFFIRNLGYDGLILEKIDSRDKAESIFRDGLSEIKKWDEEHPDLPSDKGIIVIEESVIFSDHPEEILG